MNVEHISQEDWEAISATCITSKWKIVLNTLMLNRNQPQDLEALDVILKKEILQIQDIIYPSNQAITSLNGYLNRGEVPYRIKKVSRGENCYRGTIQLIKHKKAIVRSK